MTKLVGLFDCQFRGGRAEAAPKTRVEATDRATMADMNGVSVDEEQDPVMPRTTLGQEDLDKYFPSVEVPEAVDAGDPLADQVDHTLEAGLHTVDELVKALATQGNRRHLR